MKNCKLCGKSLSEYDQRFDDGWCSWCRDLRIKIEHDPDLAVKILNSLPSVPETKDSKRIAELESIVAKLYVPDPGLTNSEMQAVGGILARLIKGKG